MKKLNLLLLFILSLNGYSQTLTLGEILDIDQYGWENSQGTYYKDLNNVLDPFVGTYVYENGGKYFKIVLQKKIQSTNGYCYVDLIIGEYQYIKDGVEKVNTLNRLTIINPDKRVHTITGNGILTGQTNGCYDCADDEQRLRLGIVDATSGAIGSIQIRRVIVGGQDAIKFNMYWHIRGRREEDPELLNPELKGGEYIMIKQP